VDLAFQRRKIVPFQGPAARDDLGYLLRAIDSSRSWNFSWDERLSGSVPKWNSMTPEEHAKLGEAFLAHLSQSSFPGSPQWSADLLRETMAMAVFPNNGYDSPLVLAGRLLRQSFAERLAVATGLTLQESLASPGVENLRSFDGKESPHMLIKREIMQERFIFRLCLGLSLAWLVYSIVTQAYISSDRRHLCPWPLTSPAAWALILRHSSLVEKLAAASEERLERLSSDLNARIGVWRCHGRAQIEGWRLDSATIDIPEAPEAESALEQKDSWWKPRNGPVSSDIVQIVVCFTVAFTIFQVCFYFQDVPVIKFLEPALERHTWSLMWLGMICLIAGLFTKGFIYLSVYDLRAYRAVNTMLFHLGETGDSLTRAWFVPWLLYRFAPASILLGAVSEILRAYQFVSDQQPWYALARARPAEESITLDYSHSRFPLFSAIRRRHKLLAVLGIWSAVTIYIPFLQANIAYPEQAIRQRLIPCNTTEGSSACKIPGGSYEWATKLDHPADPDPDVFDLALRELVEHMGQMASSDNTTARGWSSPDVTLMPIDLKAMLTRKRWEFDIVEAEDEFYEYQTIALRAGFVCEEVTPEVVARPLSAENVSAYLIEEVMLPADLASGHHPVRIPLPCSLKEPAATPGGPAASTLPGMRQMMCMRWWLDDSTEHGITPRWLVVVIRGPGFWPRNHGEMHFLDIPSAVGVECRSNLTTEPGKVLFAQMPDIFQNRNPIMYQPLFKPHGPHSTLLDATIATIIDRGLARSNTYLSNVDDPTMVLNTLVHSDFFLGDLISWSLYRHNYAACPACLDVPSLQRGAARLYASFVGILTHQPTGVPWLMKQAEGLPLVEPEIIEVWNQPKPNNLAVGLLAAFWLFYLVVSYAFNRFLYEIQRALGRELRYFDFNPLKWQYISLSLAAGGNLVGWLEDEIPLMRTEVDLAAIYKIIEAKGCRFNRILDEHGKASGINVLTSLDEYNDCEQETSPHLGSLDEESEDAEDREVILHDNREADIDRYSDTQETRNWLSEVLSMGRSALWMIQNTIDDPEVMGIGFIVFFKLVILLSLARIGWR
jgi:hypothetical protein